MNIREMRRTYVNIRRFRQVLAVLARHGFSHFLQRMRITEYLPWVGRLTDSDRGGAAPRDIPARLAEAFEELGPVYIKLGQLLAARPDLCNNEFRAAFGRMNSHATPLQWDKIHPEIELSLGTSVEDVFEVFEQDALAAGSIGQVHRARLRGGADVIVKIKRPGIDKQIREDMSLLEALAELAESHIPELAAMRPRMLARELSRTLASELDFVSEAGYCSKFGKSLEGDDFVSVPEIYWDHVTHDMLVMERKNGQALSDLDNLPQQERARLAQRLVQCFMRQYFETGIFHADPHGGNLLLQADGTVALIDFGQVGHLSGDLRYGMCRMLIALKDGDADRIVDAYSEIGEFAPDADIGAFRGELADFIDRYYGMPVDRLDFRVLSQEIMAIARRNGLYLPKDFVLLVKSMMQIAGVIRGLDASFRLDASVVPEARRLMTGMFRPDALAGRGLRLLSRFAGLIRRAPDDFRDLMEKARAGRFTIVFRHDNLQGIARRIGRATDRLTLGIITAAVIIGSSIVLSVGQTGALRDDVFGDVHLSVVLACAGFAVALLLAVFVAWGIFRDKDQSP